jgi:hypothetical protein
MIQSVRTTCAIIALLVFASISFGQEAEVKLTPSGFGSFEVGQVIRANPLTTRDADFYQADHLLFQKAFIGFNLQASYDPLPITANIGAEFKSFTETPRTKTVADNLGVGVRLFYFMYLTRADFSYTFSPAFNLDVGYFPVKYNDDARNLGEYLFRSGTYPQYLITNFDFAAARVAGVNACGTLLDNLNYKALLTINTENATMGDLNLTGIASYSLLDNALDVGAGLSFCSLISANADHTRPPKEIMKNKTDWYVDKNGDTLTYTFAGTKLMARASFDLKKYIPIDIFGKEDLKVYAEAAVLGVKNYPVSMGEDTIIDTSSLATRYDDIMKRMPIMFGVNIPAGNFLDVVSLQFEYFGSRYPNDMKNYVVYGSPAGLSAQWNAGGSSSFADAVRDNWKWSIYAKRTFAGRFFVVGQLASDHFRWDAYSYADQAYMLTEALTQTRHKYFVVKLGFSF